MRFLLICIRKQGAMSISVFFLSKMNQRASKFKYNFYDTSKSCYTFTNKTIWPRVDTLNFQRLKQSILIWIANGVQVN